ncbi:alpha/beta fold hydrolase [Actinomadura gamaensis]|uniref:Alpha/beta fold hydrolase n=1 Tax=Actinomadura gamaensis TaxID=1763541 RepID=A0ABV9UAC1_9ACTN
MSGTTMKVGDATVRYRTLGSGPGIIFVHGTGPGSVNWEGFVERFTDRYTVILPDLSGSDPVEDDGAPLSEEMLAQQVAAVIEDAGLGAVDVVGHSLGAVVVTTLAATRPDLVRRLIPVSGWSRTDDDEQLRHSLKLSLELADRPKAFARYAMLTAFSRDFLQRIGREAVDELAGGFVPNAGRVRQYQLNERVSIDHLLPQITAPTLVIGCTRDNLIPVENARALHAGIPGSTYAEIDSGHVPHAERPDEAANLISDFLTQPSAATPANPTPAS